MAYVDEAVSGKFVENYYLDFKSSGENDYTGKSNLQSSDKKNYAKAISAFGNSDGGVIVWGIKTGSSDADYADTKKPIKGVSNFVSLLEGYTSMVTSPPHPNVSNQIIFEDSANDVGYVITYIPKSNRRPFQVINEGDLRYYIRAGSSSLPATDSFLRALFGQEPQPDAFITFGVSPVEIVGTAIKMTVGVIVHNGGESVAKNINGYVHVGGRDMAVQVNDVSSFTYSKNSISGMKIGFVAKPDFILGIEQEVQPLILHITVDVPITENGIQIYTLVSADNQMSYRLNKVIDRDSLQSIYDEYVRDNTYDITTAILGKNNNNA